MEPPRPAGIRLGWEISRQVSDFDFAQSYQDASRAVAHANVCGAERIVISISDRDVTPEFRSFRVCPKTDLFYSGANPCAASRCNAIAQPRCGNYLNTGIQESRMKTIARGF